jgi:hypothetical protein
LDGLYVKGYRATAMGNDPDCVDAVTSGADVPRSASVWLDAKWDGLAVQFDLAHVVQACANPVMVPTAVLRALGARAELTDAIEAAHRGP